MRLFAQLADFLAADRLGRRVRLVAQMAQRDLGMGDLVRDPGTAHVVDNLEQPLGQW